MYTVMIWSTCILQNDYNKYLSVDEWIKSSVIHTHTRIYIYIVENYSVTKEGNLAIYDNMDETWGHCAK